eukprot:TRINITY_DN67835_c3_g2_i1.p2 TRINITY_DN67835_c3_g2~~TRINITY_DN67835_c3_g2_i1.p2  ORF type:complete len:116 (-),score=11.86 TRINITY_DN67835_c3_g2_i1:96-443(-)
MVTVLLVGAAIFHSAEGWTYPEALWFFFITITTIGLGDYIPKAQPGPGGLMIFAGLAIVAYTITAAANLFDCLVKCYQHNKQANQRCVANSLPDDTAPNPLEHPSPSTPAAWTAH